MSIAVGFDRWLDRLAEHGAEMRAHLNPPATEAEIRHLEKTLDLSLPAEARDLYTIANGQIDPWDISDLKGSRYVAPLFGHYNFLPLEICISEYLVWRQIYTDAGDSFHADFSEGIVTVRAGDPIHADYWRPGWLPIARDGGGNAYAVDLSPKEGGRVGQVILFGPDEDERRLIAPSLSELFSAAVTRELNGIDEDAPLLTFDFEDT